MVSASSAFSSSTVSVTASFATMTTHSIVKVAFLVMIVFCLVSTGGQLVRQYDGTDALSHQDVDPLVLLPGRRVHGQLRLMSPEVATVVDEPQQRNMAHDDDTDDDDDDDDDNDNDNNDDDDKDDDDKDDDNGNNDDDDNDDSEGKERQDEENVEGEEDQEDDEPESNEDVPANPPTSNKDVTTNPPNSKPKQIPTRAPTFVYTLPPGSNRTNLSISLPSSEWLEDIDTYTQVLGCGGLKCAFHSITGKHGYLVTLKNERELQQAKSAVDMAEYFAATYGIRHTVLARPITTDKIMKRNITIREIPHHKVLVSRLGTRLGRMKQNIVRRKGRRKDRKLHHGEIFIMPIDLYSAENILFKCTDEQSRAAFTMAGNLQPNKDIDPAVFAETLESDLNRTIQMMESPEAACLSKDFQLVIDTTTGGIIHIDIDRCFHGKRTLFWDKPCQKTLHSLTKVIIDRVTYGDHHPNTAKKPAGQESQQLHLRTGKRAAPK